MSIGDPCRIQPCESLTRWTLEHRGFTPTHAMSCKAHLSAAIEDLMDIEHGGIVMVHKWGNWWAAGEPTSSSLESSSGARMPNALGITSSRRWRAADRPRTSGTE